MIRVSNIERFALHDGPGIRSTIFLKGCPLHCPWCANPETWSVSPVLMHDQKKCVGCRVCEKTCPQQAITWNQEFHWNANKCLACGKCVDACIPEALSISGKNMEIEEIIEEVLKDIRYYQASDGGVTVSGGEPFVQFESFLSLLRELKKHNLHVAVETTGNYDIEKLKEALPYIDLFLFDIKHTDQKILQQITGADLERIFQNLAYITQSAKSNIIIRVPVIPGFNYERKTLCSIFDIAKQYGVLQVNLLPYHSLGMNKWNQLHKPYAYEGLAMMDKKELEEYIMIGKEYGLQVKIGG